MRGCDRPRSGRQTRQRGVSGKWGIPPLRLLRRRSQPRGLGSGYMNRYRLGALWWLGGTYRGQASFLQTRAAILLL
ncbi:hypothetical protein EMIT0373P_30742 [Pseudomonas chlororaphis]